MTPGRRAPSKAGRAPAGALPRHFSESVLAHESQEADPNYGLDSTAPRYRLGRTTQGKSRFSLRCPTQSISWGCGVKSIIGIGFLGLVGEHGLGKMPR